MQDSQIVTLYLKRDENAVQETDEKYAAYLSQIAVNILGDHGDSQECVNETYFRAWNSIPPHIPKNLRTYLGKITRQLAIDTYRTRKREKRKATEYALCLDELSECLADPVTPEQVLEAKNLEQAIDTFIRTLDKEKRMVFVCRYYYMDSIATIATRFSMTESKVKSMLHRTRRGLRKHLQEEGYSL